jgi:uncharacterized protein
VKRLTTLGLFVLLTFQGSVLAEDSPPANSPDKTAVKLARSILDDTHAGENAQLAIKAMTPLIVQSLKRDKADIPDAVIQKFIPIFQQKMDADIPRMLDIQAEIYARHYSVTELTTIAKFYESDVGKKVIRETPQILKETVPLGEAWGREVGTRAALETLEVLRQQGEKI